MYSHFFSHKRVSLLYMQHNPHKIALKNDANNGPKFPFSVLRTFFSEFPKKLVNQQDTGKLSNFEQQK